MNKKLHQNSSSSYLFAYGTLLSNVPNRLEHTLRNYSKLIGHAYTHGKLYDLGDYPGAVFDNNSRFKVHGELILITNNLVWKELDNYEESGPQWPDPNEYVRVLTDVHCLSHPHKNEILECYAYSYNFPVLELDHIRSGDYNHFLENIRI